MKEDLYLDPESDLYRECPQCGEPFMTDHRNRKFCSEQHHNDFNNAQKRKMLNELLETEIAHVPLQPVNSENVAYKEKLTANINILETFIIDPKRGSHFRITDLLKKGFTFSTVSFRFILYNTTGSYCMQYGNYKLYRTNPEFVLIYKTQ